MTHAGKNLTPSFFIKFHTELRTCFNSTSAALIIGRLEFWFENKKFKNGFYKFLEPCGHPLYREGDSWSEELGLSRKLFGKAFDIIGVRYKSKSAYLKAENKFQGKLYASYHDRKTNRTYFIRNHEFVSQFLGELFKKPPSPVVSPLPKKQKAKKDQDSPTKTINPKTSHTDQLKGRSRNGDLGRSFNIQEKTSSSLRQTNQNLSKNSPKEDPGKKDFMEGMIKIWNEEIGELGIPTITKGLSTRLNKVFETCFNNSLQTWKDYCQLISSSKFLMGEAKNKFFKKAWITWAIKPETIESIKGGAYTLGDRQTTKDREVEKINNEINNLETKKRSIEEYINNFKKLTTENRKKTIKEKRKNISEKEHEIFKNEFIQFLEIDSSPITDEFKRAGWKGLFVECTYLSFLEEKIGGQLFKTSDEVNENQAIKESGLLKILEDVESELDTLRQKKMDIGLKSRESFSLFTPFDFPSLQSPVGEDLLTGKIIAQSMSINPVPSRLLVAS